MDRTFDPDEVLHDGYLLSYGAFDTEGFLKDEGSPLVSLRCGGFSVAQVLEAAAEAACLDVRVLLARLEAEQSLVTLAPTAERLERAMGYGLTDIGPDWVFRDFTLQVVLGARELAGLLRDDHPFSVKDQVGLPMNVRDGLVTPRNAATAALYRSVPWIGQNPFFGRPSPFGNCRFFTVWRNFFGSDPRDFSPLPSPGSADTAVTAILCQATVHRELLLDFESSEGGILKILVDGVDQAFSDLQVNLLDVLASPPGRFVDRDELTARLSVTTNHLYGLIKRVRDKIGPDHLEQVGTRVSSHGRTRGQSGYRLKNVTVLRTFGTTEIAKGY